MAGKLWCCFVVLLFKCCVGKLVYKTDLCVQSPAAAWERWEPGKALNCQMVGTQTSFRCWRKPSTLSGLFKMKSKTAAEKSPSSFCFLLHHFSVEWIREWSNLLWRWPQFLCCLVFLTRFWRVLVNPSLGVLWDETHHPSCPSHLARASAFPEVSPSCSPRKLLSVL